MTHSFKQLLVTFIAWLVLPYVQIFKECNFCGFHDFAVKYSLHNFHP